MQRQPTIFKVILHLAFCFTSLRATAQYDCSIKNFNTENGLPQNEITAMSMDKDGYLWLGTRSGLIRYDGAGFKTFLNTQKNNNFLSTNILYTMYIPADKKLMVKTRIGEVYSIQNGRPTIFSDFSSEHKNNSIIVLGNFPSYPLFKQLHKSMFKLLSPKALENISVKLLPNTDDNFLSLLPISNEDFLLGSTFFDKLLYFKNGGLQKTVQLTSQPKNFISSKSYQFLVDSQYNISVFDSDSIRFKKVSFDWKSIKSKGADIREIQFYSDPYSGEAFCFYNSIFYLLRFDPNRKLMKFVPQFSIKERTHFWSAVVYDSASSTFFLSTPNEGFFQVRLKKIQTFNLIEKAKGEFRSTNVISFTVLKTSDSTVVAHSGSQFTVTSSGIKVTTLGNLFGESLTLGLLTDNSVLCTRNGRVYCYSPADNYMIRHVFNDSFNRQSTGEQIESLHLEGDSVWVSTLKAFYCITKKNIKLLYERDSSGQSSKPYNVDFRLFFRLNKNEAFVSNESGMYRMRTSPPYRFDAIPELTGKFVRQITRYKNVLILSVYRNGLYVLKENRFYKVPMREDFNELRSCHSTYVDKKGYIWIPTDKGLFKSTVSSVIESALNEGPEPFFFYYGKADGIDNTEFNGSGTPTYAILKDEHLFYPSMGGIVSFTAGDMDKEIMNTPIFIEEILADNNEIYQSSDSVRLRPGINLLSIDFSTANFEDPKNQVIEYRMDSMGWKKIPADDRKRITLLNIASGDHLLTIRKRTGFGKDDYVYRTLSIYKNRAIYESFWFYPAILLMIILLGWFFLLLKTHSLDRKRAQLQKLVEEQTTELSRSAEVKDLLISIIAHDMVTPLRHVGLVAEILEKDLEKDPQKIKGALGDIKSTSQKILSGSLSIINWMKYNIKKIQLEKRSVSLYGLINETLEVFVPIAKNKNIELHNEVPKSSFVEVDYNIFVTILNNLISNAVKYTATGNIKIEVNDTDGSLPTVLTISDTGKGMNEESLEVIREVLDGNLQAIKATDKINTGLGYVMISELAKIHGLSVTIESVPGRGTKVSVAIP